MSDVPPYRRVVVFHRPVRLVLVEEVPSSPSPRAQHPVPRHRHAPTSRRVRLVAIPGGVLVVVLGVGVVVVVVGVRTGAAPGCIRRRVTKLRRLRTRGRRRPRPSWPEHGAPHRPREVVQSAPFGTHGSVFVTRGGIWNPSGHLRNDRSSNLVRALVDDVEVLAPVRHRELPALAVRQPGDAVEPQRPSVEPVALTRAVLGHHRDRVRVFAFAGRSSPSS